MALCRAAMMSFPFTSGDLASPLWHRLKRYLEEHRAELRAENDSIHLDEVQTAYKRGRISEITELLDAANPHPEDTP